MIDISRFLPIPFSLIIGISSIHTTYANNVYYRSENKCESGEETELADCLRNEVIESTMVLRHAEDSIKIRIKKWSEEKDAALDDAIPVALYRLEESSREFVCYRFTQCSFAESWGNGVGS
ncbi:DUF1311 domain-containing protein [Salmonella enterica]